MIFLTGLLLIQFFTIINSCFVSLDFVRSTTVNQSPEYISITEGDNVTLTCSYFHVRLRISQIDSLIWSYTPGRDSVNCSKQLLVQKINDFEQESYMESEGRYHSWWDMSNNSNSLLIMDLQQSDTGRYCCEVVSTLPYLSGVNQNGTMIIVQEKEKTPSDLSSTQYFNMNVIRLVIALSLVKTFVIVLMYQKCQRSSKAKVFSSKRAVISILE
ncbi:uncharacterized protein LOC122799557 [Protopterus annectens]|uniref:uncharacterized protein LOC122799557 n=1 Tax=Protopterus annectens TaxID=7888 RepID=UPI001CFB79EE|nr:uncharacterized protein LOC122799557 [Protopterus annectens]